MNRAEIIEGLKEIYYRLYAFTDHRKTLEACLKLLESENALIDRVLEIIDDMCRDEEAGYVISRKMVYVLASELRDRILALKGGEKE